MINDQATLAVDGGRPVRTVGFPAWPQGGDAESALLAQVVNSADWGPHGEQVARFERRFAMLHESVQCVAVANATVGLEVALKACGVGRGDEVILPSYTFIACASAILHLGAIPVFVDIDPDTSVLDPELIRAAIGPHTKAIMVVHYCGRPCAMDEIMALAGEHGLRVVEDAAQAHGAAWQDRAVGAWGNLGVFSFQASKNISAGEGGAVVGNDPALMDAVYSMTHLGRIPGGEFYEHRGIGSNLRLGEFQGAVLNAQLDRFGTQQRQRTDNAARLDQLLSDVPGIHLPRPDERITRHGWHRYMFRVPKIQRVQDQARWVEAMRAEGIPCQPGNYRDHGLHRNDAVVEAARANAADAGRTWSVPELPFTELVARDALWLQQRLLLTEAKAMEDIAAAIAKVARSAPGTANGNGRSS